MVTPIFSLVLNRLVSRCRSNDNIIPNANSLSNSYNYIYTFVRINKENGSSSDFSIYFFMKHMIDFYQYLQKTTKTRRFMMSAEGQSD